MSAATPQLPAGPLSEFDDAVLADLFTLVYTGYAVPMHADAAAIRFMRTSFDWDLAASRVLRDGGEPVAIAILAHRGDAGWIGGMGVAPSHRGRRLGERVMREVLDSARALGLRRVGLEVLVQNEHAFRLYEQLGFRTTRELEVWSFAPPDSGGDGITLEPVPFVEALAFVGAHRAAREPWQRADRSLTAMHATGTALEGLLARRDGQAVGGMVFRAAGRASVLQLATAPAGDEDVARALLGALRRDDAPQGGRWLNLPANDPVAPLVHSLEPKLEARQYEMELAL